MFFWNSLAISMIQRILAIWSLVPLPFFFPLPFLNPVWTSGSSWFTHYWSLAWRILSITLLACEMSAIVQFECTSALQFAMSAVWIFFGIALLGIEMKTDLFQFCGHCWVFQICWHIEGSTLTASSFRIWNRSSGIPGEGNVNPLQYSCLENPMDGGAW